MAKRVLVVEDNKVNRDVIAHILEALDFEITFAHNGFQAVEQVEASKFDIILMDINMPLMDGVEATRIIRGFGGWCESVPIIAVTANEAVGVQTTYIPIGLTDVILKPIDPRALSAVIQQHLPE
jgi:CheY-like chemotaxis protein